MGLEVVLKEIEDSAQNEVDHIISEAVKISNDIISSAEQKVKNDLEIDLKNVQDEIEKKRKQIVSSANLEVKRISLNKKKELLDKIYLEVVNKIKEMDQNKNEELLISLVKKYEKIGYNIYSNNKSENIIKKISTLNYSGSIDCIGGIVIENESGTIKEDYTYDSILKRIYERSLKSISEILYR